MVKINIYIFTKLWTDNENLDKIEKTTHPPMHDREDVEEMEAMWKWCNGFAN